MLDKGLMLGEGLMLWEGLMLGEGLMLEDRPYAGLTPDAGAEQLMLN